LIILEGPDGSGKTTLARELQAQGCQYIHCTYRWPDRMPQYHTAVLFSALEQALASGRPTVIDRWWPSEYIYGEVFRGGTRFTHYGRLLDRMAIRFGALYVFCLPGDKVKYRTRFEELAASGREKYVNVEKMLDARQGYIQMLGDTFSNRYDTWIYDFQREGGDLPPFARAMIFYSKFMYHKQFNPRLDTTIAGNLRGDVLLVGDQHNLKWRVGRPCWPFFEYGNCSLYLAKVLDEARVDESRLCYININHPTGVFDVQHWLDHRDPDLVNKVLIFGNDAEATWLANFKHDYVLLPHPQAGRRFPSYGKQFVRSIKEELCS